MINVGSTLIVLIAFLSKYFTDTLTKYFFELINSFWATLGLCCCLGFSLWWLLLLPSTGSRGRSFSSCGWKAVEHRCAGLSCCATRGIFLDQGSNPALAGGFFMAEPSGKS